MGEYRAFAGKLQPLPSEFEFSFFGEKGKYMLVYATKKPNEGFTEIPADKECNLSTDERGWLRECKTIVTRRFMEENKDIVVPTIEMFIDLFQQELEKIRKERCENERPEN